MRGYSKEELVQIKNFMILKDFVRKNPILRNGTSVFEIQKEIDLRYLNEYLTTRIRILFGHILTLEELQFLQEEIIKRVPCSLHLDQSSIFIDFSILGIEEFKTKMVFGIEYFEENDISKER